MKLNKELDVVIKNLKRLNNLHNRGKISKDNIKEFLLYKSIAKANDTGNYSKDIIDIINS